MKFTKYISIIMVIICLTCSKQIVQAKDYIFMIDNSGSMRHRSHDANRRIPDSIRQFVKLVDKHYPREERVSIIMFEDEATVLLPLTQTEYLIENDEKLLNNAFGRLDYRGQFTIFKHAFETFLKAMDYRSSETYLILITDGFPSQDDNNRSRDEYLTSQDTYKTEALIQKKIRNNKRINLMLIPFSNRISKKYLKRFAKAADQADSLQPKVTQGEELFQRLKSRFVFICADFPGGDVHFSMKILIDDEEGVFTNVFDIVKSKLPSFYSNVKLRKVHMKRKIDYDLEWESTQDPKVQSELMRKHKVNGLCMIYASDEQSFKFKLIGCQQPDPIMGYCRTRTQMGVDMELAKQFIYKYQEKEKQIIESVVPYDEASITVQVKQKGDKLPAIKGLRCHVDIMDPDNPNTIYSKIPDQFESKTNLYGMATIQGIPRGVPFRLNLKPKAFTSLDPIAIKYIEGGWKDKVYSFDVEIDDNEKNYPKVEIMTYAKPNEFSPSIIKTNWGNTFATLKYRTMGESSWHDLVEIKDNRQTLNKNLLLRGYTYEITAKFRGFLKSEDSETLPEKENTETYQLSEIRELDDDEDRYENNLTKKISPKDNLIKKAYPKDDSPDLNIYEDNYDKYKSFEANEENQSSDTFTENTSIPSNETQYSERYYFDETIKLFTGGLPVIKIPFYLNIPLVVRQNLSNGLYIGKEKELYSVLKDFFKDSIDAQGETCAFKMSTDLSIFKMLCEVTSKLDFSPDKKVQLWGLLLKTKYNCKKDKFSARFNRKTAILATSFILLKLIDQYPDKNSFKFRSDAEGSIKDIKHLSEGKYRIYEISAKEQVEKYFNR